MENLYVHRHDSPERLTLEEPLMLPVRASLAMRPWVVYGPLWIQWVVLNFAGKGAWIGPTVLRQLFAGPRTELNLIFPVTWTCAVISFIVTILLLLGRTSFLNLFFISAGSQFGASFLFEFVFSIVALVRHGYPILYGDCYYLLVGASWLVMILCGLGYWSPNPFFYVSILVFTGGFFVWMLIGFPILAGLPSLVLNYVTKIAAFSVVTSLYFER
jgi:hypothetical protein